MFRGPHIQMSMCCKKRRLAIVGYRFRMSICQMILGEGSQNSLYWKRSLQKDTCGPGGDWRRFKRHPDQIMFGQKYGRKLVKPLRIEKNRNGQKKSQKLTMLDNWEEFTLLIQDDEEYKEILKDAWHQACHAEGCFILVSRKWCRAMAKRRSSKQSMVV